MRALLKLDWRLQFVVSPSDLLMPPNESRFPAIGRFMNVICDRLEIPASTSMNTSECSADTWQVCTEVEALYLDEMMHWGDGDPIGKADALWSAYEGFSQNGIVWQKPLVPVGYKKLKRKNKQFFARKLRFERMFRSDTGFFVAYRILETGTLNSGALATCYVRVFSRWKD